MPCSTAPLLLMFLTRAICVNGEPLPSTPQTRTGKSTETRWLRRRSMDAPVNDNSVTTCCNGRTAPPGGKLTPVTCQPWPEVTLMPCTNVPRAWVQTKRVGPDALVRAGEHSSPRKRRVRARAPRRAWLSLTGPKNRTIHSMLVQPSAFIAALPKAELHLHLEGSIDAPTLLELRQRHGKDGSVEELAQLYQYSDFAAFLQAFKTI